jgi:ATP-dependent Lhr-like helicase
VRFFAEPTRAYFRATFGKPTRAQALGWPPIVRGESTLILAPTGSGKTLAAFLSAIDRLAFGDGGSEGEACKVLYVSPLKALAVDVERNLRAPLVGIEGASGIRVGVRTGDTPASERARMVKHPPDILITTPESLYLLLTSDARKILATVDTVIIDEIHQLVSNKRGAHLFLSLERLEALRADAKRQTPLQRIGLSATQRPLSETARLLGGYVDGAQRPVTVVDAGGARELVLSVQVPNIDMSRIGQDDDAEEADAKESRHSIWPHLHPRIVELVRAHRSTMIFVNSRRLAERLATALNDLAGSEIALAHHGSVAREKRAMIEDRLKRGDLPAIVATSSLELGIDMGAVDLVIQVEAPPSIASGIQRVGRASHQVGGVPRGVLMPKHRADLLACAAASAGMIEGAIEESFVLKNPLDVLAQQIVAIVSSAPAGKDHLAQTSVEACFDLVRRAAPFCDLPRSAFEGVLDMLSGRYPADDFAELRPRLTWDRLRNTLRARSSSKRLAIVNGGTIPDRGLYGVFLATGSEKTGRRVGELDEEMVFELREGEVFLLGASSWRADTITSDRVLVTPAAGEPGKMPFWHGDRAGRTPAFGARIGALTRRIAKAKPAEAARFLEKEHHLDKSAAMNLVSYVGDQLRVAPVPTDDAIVVERFVDDIGDLRVCILSPFGMRVHAPWAMAVLAKLRSAMPGDPDVVWSDDGIAFRITSTSDLAEGASDGPSLDLFFPSSEEVEALVTASLSGSSLFAARFRESAARALLLPRRFPGKRSPLWAQRKRASDLLAVASRYPSVPIVLETYRECLRDVFDLPALRDVLGRVETRRMRTLHVETTAPSPFASSLLFTFVANFIYDGDAPLAERRAHALSIDHAQLREILGESELRQLFDDDLLEAHERHLQRLDSPATSADALTDVLRVLGDLSASEVEQRSKGDHRAWLEELEVDRRIVRVRVAKEARYCIVEDAARYRDGLGVALPTGLPDALLDPSRQGRAAGESDAFVTLVARYARTHGPFVTSDVARRFGTQETRVAGALEALVRRGRVVVGAFTPRGTTLEHCDKEVLGALRRKALAALRKEVEPVDAATYQRFLMAWQGVHQSTGGAHQDALLAAITQLEGCPLLASSLETEILPARVPDYRPGDLDGLVSAGLVVWCGVASVGARDGRVALYLAEHEPVLTTPPRTTESPLAARIRATLQARGALFFDDLARSLEVYAPEVHEALWDMIWCGEVTNDTLEPLRALVHAAAPRGRPLARHLGPSAFVRGLSVAQSARGVGRGYGGRFSLRATRWARLGENTEHRAALATALLERYGVVVRECAHAESIGSGFGAVYDVLKALEDGGRIRRGYFVDGAGAAQFATPEAADRLRLERTRQTEAAAEPAHWLAATDPANAYGALLPFPTRSDEARPQRERGAHVVLHAGRLLAWLSRGESAMLTFPASDEAEQRQDAARIARCLAQVVSSSTRRALLIATIDGAAPTGKSTPLGEALLEAGFVAGARGWMKRQKRRFADDPLESDDLPS